jgi:hypothetical protein
MTQGGAAQPVTVVTSGPVEGRAALPVAVVSGPVQGGPCQPVYVVTSGPVAGGAPIPVALGNGPALGGPAIPVYVVSGSLGGVAGPSTLLTSLISYWKLEEASGTRADAVTASGNDLTDNNTVTQNPGIIANAAQFTRVNTEYLSHADNASLSTGDIDYTVAAWVYLDSKPGNMGVIAKDSGGANREYVLQYTNASVRFVFTVLDTAGSTIGLVTANTFGAPATATWYLVIAWHDSVNNVVGISVNAGTADTAVTTGVPADKTATFYIGADQAVSNWDGRIDEVGFWKKVLTATERTTLYNGGVGRTYPFTGAP